MAAAAAAAAAVAVAVADADALLLLVLLMLLLLLVVVVVVVAAVVVVVVSVTLVWLVDWLVGVVVSGCCRGARGRVGVVAAVVAVEQSVAVAGSGSRSCSQ